MGPVILGSWFRPISSYPLYSIDYTYFSEQMIELESLTTECGCQQILEKCKISWDLEDFIDEKL